MANGLAVKHERLIRQYKRRRDLVDDAGACPNLSPPIGAAPLGPGQNPNIPCQGSPSSPGERDANTGIPLPDLSLMQLLPSLSTMTRALARLILCGI